MQSIVKLLLGLIIISIFILGFYAYMIRSVDGGIIYDGLGRQLSLVPLFARFFVPDSLWAGFGWYVIDFIIFFGGIGIAVFLISLTGENE
jgi:hypothetical protein